jgi:hypothetical protein
MINFILYILLGLVTVFIAVLGGHVSSGNRKHRYTFYILGAFSVVLIILTGYQNYLTQAEGNKSRKQLADSIESLNNTSKIIANMSKEALRVGSLNTRLQEQLLKTSNKVVDLSKEGMKITTGSDSFCYAIAMFTSQNVWIPVFVHSGKYPLYSVHASIADLSKLGKTTNIFDLLQERVTVDLGDLSNQLATPYFDKPILVSGEKKQGYNIFYNARNGVWHQMLRFANVNGQWLQATKVYRSDGKLVFDNVSNNFPKDVDWK